MLQGLNILDKGQEEGSQSVGKERVDKRQMGVKKEENVNCITIKTV